MAHARPSRSLLLWLIIGGVLLGGADASTQGRADTPFPVYRHAELEGRFQVETPLPRKPSPALEAAALGRARAAARARDEAALAEAARDIVIHAEAAATGWSKAATVWAGLYGAWRVHGRDRDDYSERREAQREARESLRRAAYSLYAGYRWASDPSQAATILVAFGIVQESLEEYTSAELALAAALTARENNGARDRLERIRKEHGFRIADILYDRDREDPRICLTLSTPVARKHRHDFEDYVVLEPHGGDHPTVLRDAAVCIGNLDHGASYTVAIREGLQDVHGRTVVPSRHRVKVPDRPAWARFSKGRYVIPAVGNISIPLTTVNVDEVLLTLLRITEANLVDEASGGSLGKDLAGYDLREIAEELGEQLWQGTLAIDSSRNREVVTAIDVASFLPEHRSGVYVLAATIPGVTARGYEFRAVQWFVVSDIGLLTIRGADGLSVFARSLATAEPIAGVKLFLLARNKDTLATLETDAQGRVTFAPGLLRGSGGRRAVLLRASAGNGDHTFLPLNRPGMDLSDRDTAGRPWPGSLDAYLYTDQGIYRPGDTVHLTALVRDGDGRAVVDLPFELSVTRPDGVQAREYLVRSDHTGAIPMDHVLSDSAVTGAWQFLLRVPGADGLVGTASVKVEDFVPPRLEVAVEVPESVDSGTAVPVAVTARFLYGAPAAGVSVKGRVEVAADPEPFAAWSGYRFGPVEDPPLPGRADLPATRTGEDGIAVLSLDLPRVAETAHPLRARIDAAVLESGGRAVGKTVVFPLRDGRERIGIRPRPAGGVAVGQSGLFEVALVDRAGAAVAGRQLTWRLYREERAAFRYMRPGKSWRKRAVTMDTTVESGTLRTAPGTGGPARIVVAPRWGSYRLEVTDPSHSGALPASVRFRVGWGGGDSGGDVPDRMTVRLDRRRYAPGDTATVRLEAPFDGVALVTVLTDRVMQSHHVRVVDGRATVALPVERWTAGAYVAATVFRPAPARAEEGPGRAVGIAWLEVHEPARILSVDFDAPETAPSGKSLRVPLRATDGTGATVEARVTVAAVDEGILGMTAFASPDPVAAMLGKRSLGVELLDLYGRLIHTRRGDIPKEAMFRSGGDARGRLWVGVQPPQRTVALYQGLMRTDAHGRGEVLLDIPEGFSGRLRLMAVAHTKEALGQGADRVVIRDPLTVDLYLPRFLTPGDNAQVTVEMANTSAPAGSYAPTLTVNGAATLSRALPDAVSLEPGQRWSMPVTLSAAKPGEAVLRLAAAGPGGVRVERTWTLVVRPAQAWRQTRRTVTLEPGGSLKLTRALVDNLYPTTAHVSASVSPVPYDLQALLATLDRYPYGCTEQTISRALPLVYLNELGEKVLGSDGDSELPARIQGAVRRVLSRQTADGGFGLWSAREDSKPWISAYALDFLERARAEGYEVDAGALRRARDYVAGLMRRGRPSDVAWEAYAYGLAVLARSKAVEPGTVRYLINNRLDRVGSGMGRAQLALAAASFGLTDSAATAFASAVPALGGNAHSTYGSRLRDAAALVAVAAAIKPATLEAAATHLRRVAAEDSRTSTQEQAWMVLAAWELTRAAATTRLTVDGVAAVTGQGGFHHAVASHALEGNGVTIGNPGDRPVKLLVSVGGQPVAEEPTYANGTSITRTIRTPAGAPADLANVAQGDELIVVLEGRLAEGRFQRRLLVADLLPAGLEIQAAIVEDGEHGVVEGADRPDALRLRDDRYVAALSRNGGESFRLAYLVRAVTPGTFRVPAPYVEDMYDPAIQARGAMGRLTVHP